jgi:hypothetical protein
MVGLILCAIFLFNLMCPMYTIGFSHTGVLHNPNHFATNLPDNVPIVLVFGAQATRGIVASDHPYVSFCGACTAYI